MNTATSSSFLTEDELANAGFRSVGQRVRVSRHARFYGTHAISLRDDCRIDDFCIVSAAAPVEIGRHCHVAAFCLLVGRSGIEIGDYCGISARTAIYSESDDISGQSMFGPSIPLAYKPGYKNGPVVLATHVFVATACTILPGSQFAQGAAMTAHSLWRGGDAKSWTVYGGVPATARGPRAKDVLALTRAFEMESPATDGPA